RPAVWEGPLFPPCAAVAAIASGMAARSGARMTRRRVAHTSGPATRNEAPDYWLTRFLVLRLLGLVYLVAFLCLAEQLLPLLGARGLLPIQLFLDHVAARAGARGAGFLQVPSLFWLDASDGSLEGAAWAGVALSIPVLLGFANGLLLAVLWALYMSFG